MSCRRWTAVACALLTASAVTGCGREDKLAEVDDEGAAASATSSPFVAGPPPEGYALFTAGLGNRTQIWSEDSVGSDEPFALLAPPGAAADDPDAVLVSVTGYQGYEGGLNQAASGYPANLETSEELTIDGQPALYTPPHGANTAAEIVAVRGDDFAVRVRGVGRTKDELIKILGRVRPSTETTQAPDVDPTGGLTVVGTVDAGVVAGFAPFAQAHSDSIPGPPSAHTVVWSTGSSSHGAERTLAAYTLPGSSADLEAIPGIALHPDFASATVSTAGTGADTVTVVDLAFEGVTTRRAVFRSTQWGDVVMVVASEGELPTAEVMAALAETVSRVDDQRWNAFVVEATGGPGLHADAGAVELARGQAADLEWLLQARLSDGLASSVNAEPVLAVDPCLKLSNRHRACASAGVGGEFDTVLFTGDDALDEYQVDPFVIVGTRIAGTSIRITTPTDTATAGLVPIPGTDDFGAVVFVSGAGLPACHERPEPPPPSITLMRVDVLDAQGQTVGCVGDTPQ